MSLAFGKDRSAGTVLRTKFLCHLLWSPACGASFDVAVAWNNDSSQAYIENLSCFLDDEDLEHQWPRNLEELLMEIAMAAERF